MKYEHTGTEYYGIELMLDLHDCDIKTFTKDNVKKYFDELCALIDMEKYGEPVFWHDDSHVPHLRGVSAMQFITTSNIVVHALENLDAVFVNIFSCKEYDAQVAADFTKRFFGAQTAELKIIERK